MRTSNHKALIATVTSIIVGFTLALCLASAAWADDGDVETGASGTDTSAVDEQTGTEAVRDEKGQVSWLNTDSHNPYHSLMTLCVVVGAEFADYTTASDSEGYIVKCRPGDVVELPAVKAKDGYTFVGWSQGGVPDEIDWDVWTGEVEMTDEVSSGERKVYVYALYADDEGDGYCACGAWKEGAYSNGLNELKEAYSAYLSAHETLFGNPSSYPSTAVFIGCCVGSAIIGMILCGAVGWLAAGEHARKRQFLFDNKGKGDTSA